MSEERAFLLKSISLKSFLYFILIDRLSLVRLWMQVLRNFIEDEIHQLA